MPLAEDFPDDGLAALRRELQSIYGSAAEIKDIHILPN
jgi:hypothetical protein